MRIQFIYAISVTGNLNHNRTHMRSIRPVSGGGLISAQNGATMTQTREIYNVHVISESPSITMNNQSGVALGHPGKVSTTASRVIVTPLTSNVSTSPALSQPPRQAQRQLISKVLIKAFPMGVRRTPRHLR